MNALKSILYGWSGGNEKLFSLIYGAGTDSLKPILPALEWLGDFKNFPYFFVLTVLMIGVKYIMNRGSAKEYNQRVIARSIAWLFAFVGSFALVLLIVSTLKEEMEFARPYIALAPDIVPLYGNIPVGEAYKSFPSGSAAFAALWAIALCAHSAFFIKLLLFIAVMLVCWFRVAIGVHFPADVVAGAIIGSMTFIIVNSIIFRIIRR